MDINNKYDSYCLINIYFQTDVIVIVTREDTQNKMTRRKRRKFIIFTLLVIFWLFYKYLINSGRPGPVFLLNSKIVKCVNNEDLFNISSSKVFRGGRSELEEGKCKNPFV